MNITDKKNEIIGVLQSTDNEQLIEEVYELLHAGNAVETVDINSLPLEVQHKIKRATDDYKTGNYITHTEMQKKVKLWL